MTRAALNVLAAVSIALLAGAGAANAVSGGIPLEPASNSQVTPVGAQGDPIGVAPGSSSPQALACLLQSISSGAKYCLS
ncbi:hypothetical protein NDR87_25520 [Nocardia sp. CDC159]|uniref:Uncharacterized protein n=1 Tax=Nocardia pulmonis TaxID=2951408 RepID=A0A9X2IXM7_9NOCA|nr:MULTISPECIES: hypothetical protein [Nocardia]MCM6774804.1 hypothetical protein [Nocardia pulmonis]MCM6789735.1 hypothetical protein [Nocardia sp. CDC159]